MTDKPEGRSGQKNRAYRRYVDGEITVKQLVVEIEAISNFGPSPLLAVIRPMWLLQLIRSYRRL